ncbi:hypothetical protein KIN20_006866 [Parelaphostrongylus tenuis]|uniref:Uncharacterized protein n=1 Tax=Parelaphostrongylus tenuis TaxID=148309 RepID=A0AAD5M2F3_PARTN|nr:hypothetical protein KIN20_006866 [Parelaphostrongylus tenuis]
MLAVPKFLTLSSPRVLKRFESRGDSSDEDFTALHHCRQHDYEICTHVNNRTPMYSDMTGNVMIISPVNYTSISGTLMTTNIIMANWPRTIWQSVLYRAVQMLVFCPFGSNFFSASATNSGNWSPTMTCSGQTYSLTDIYCKITALINDKKMSVN